MLALRENGFDINDPDHIIVVLGDLLDRGPKSLECLQFVNNLPKSRKILIQGNHEDLLQSILRKKFLRMHDFTNGTVSSIFQIIGKKEGTISYDEAISLMINNQDWKTYYESCINYWEDNNNIFVHGWIPCDYQEVYGEVYDPCYKENWRDGNWSDARWLNGMSCWDKGVRVPGKTIWCGHWHSSWGHCNLHNDGREFLSKIETYYIDPDTGKQMPYARHDPFIDEGIIAMDACTASSKIVNCRKIEVEDENFKEATEAR